MQFVYRLDVKGERNRVHINSQNFNYAEATNWPFCGVNSVYKQAVLCSQYFKYLN